MPNEPVHFVNGKFVTEKDLALPVRDLGFTRGFAVFDFFITYGKKPFMLSRHIDRLFNSAKLINLATPWTKEEVSNWVLETLNKNEGGEKAIKIIASGGVSDSLLPSGESNLFILIDPLVQFPEDCYKKGVGATMLKHARYLPEAKTNNYIEVVRRAEETRNKGAIEPVYYNDEQVFEGSNSNVFAVIGGKLLTPKSNILAGVTRGVLLEILKLDIPVKEKNFSLEEFLSASEVFFSSSNKEVMPITKIDGKAVGDGGVGEVTKEVMKQFREFIS